MGDTHVIGAAVIAGLALMLTGCGGTTGSPAATSPAVTPVDTQTIAGSTCPVDTVETIYVRDGVWIYQSASNTDGEALLTDLIAAVWGS